MRRFTVKDIKPGFVFAGEKSPDIHNEVVAVECGLCKVDQYGATLATQDRHNDPVFKVKEVVSMLNRGLAHVILERGE